MQFGIFEMAWGSLSHEPGRRSLELFATEVMPRFPNYRNP